MYGIEFEVPEDVLDDEFTIEIGKAKIMQEGSDVTITAFSKMVGVALEAAQMLEEQGISAEVSPIEPNLRSST